jgi:hypothetical protein
MKPKESAQKKPDHKRKVKHFLELGFSVTQQIAIRLWGNYRLSSCIHRLRDEGMKIKTTMKNGRNGSEYASYKLKRK